MFQSEITSPYFFSLSFRAILGFVDIVEADLLQEVADDAQHRLVIVDDEHRKGRIQCHDVSARN
jgi:hypothetical protein